jgi:hypothetical protein
MYPRGLLLLLLASPLLAGDEVEALRRCAAIPNDAQRLACYDAWARPAGPGVSGWSRLDPAERLAVGLAAEKDIRGQGQTHRPQLVVACRDGALAVWIHTGLAAESEHDGEEKTVILRFDTEPPFTERFAEAETHDALIFPSGLMAATQLLRRGMLSMQFMPRRSPAASMVFRLEGLEQAIAPLLEACDLVIEADGDLVQREP